MKCQRQTGHSAVGAAQFVQPIFASETSTTDRPKPNTRELSSSLQRDCGSHAAVVLPLPLLSSQAPHFRITAADTSILPHIGAR